MSVTSRFKYSKAVDVRFSDCDPYGHVNNAVYLTYLEVARFGYWKDVAGGRSFGDMGFVMARIELDYKAPLTMGDTVTVWLGVTELGRTSFVFEYELFDQRGRLVAVGKNVEVMYDHELGKPAPLPEEFRAIITAFESGS